METSKPIKELWHDFKMGDMISTPDLKVLHAKTYAAYVATAAFGLEFDLAATRFFTAAHTMKGYLDARKEQGDV